jgi:isocitrate/isopropylmalate dehydrogenase
VQFAAEKLIPATLIAGDGIGPANILKALTGLFLETAREVGKHYEGRVQVDDRIVDACAMQLVLNPWQFDVIVTTNLFGDILSDEMAGLVGGLGMAPAANIGVDANGSEIDDELPGVALWAWSSA